MGVFSPDSKLMQTFNRAADIFALNVLWLVFSIPIITIGASTTAKYAVGMRVVRGKMPELLKEYVKAFKANFKQATLLWLPMLLVIAGLSYETLFVMGMESAMAAPILILLLIMLMLVLMMLMWGWPLLARYETRYLAWFRNSLYIALMNFSTGLLLLALSVSPYILFYFYPEWLVAELAIPIISGYAISASSVKILKKYEPAGYVDPDDEPIDDDHETFDHYHPENEATEDDAYEGFYEEDLKNDPELQMYASIEAAEKTKTENRAETEKNGDSQNPEK